MIFVFGSNLSGIHGAGAAYTALIKHGAIRGQAYGFQGNSFAIPTKDKTIKFSLNLNQIQSYVNLFIKFAKDNPDKQFQITRIGCGLAGLKDEDIAPMFLDAPDNCFFDQKWEYYLLKAMGPKKIRSFKYWGTF